MDAVMTKPQRFRAWITPAALMILTALGVAPAEADTILFNPGGISGAQEISLFNYASSSILAYGLSNIQPGATVPIYYESVISGAQGKNGNVFGVGNNFNLDGSGKQFTVVAGFYETITNVTPVGGGNFTLTFALATDHPSFFAMYANNVTNAPNDPNAANPSTGGGANFEAGTLIMSGTVSTSGFGGAFTTTNNSVLGSPGPFNTSGLPTANTTTKTVTGFGGTGLTIDVDQATLNRNYFVTDIKQLTFSTTNSLGFDQSAPLTGFYSTTGLGGPDLKYGIGNQWTTGAVNSNNPGPNGGSTSTQIQTVAHNGFVAVPEPSSIVSALTAAIVLPLVGWYRRGRRSRSAA